MGSLHVGDGLGALSGGGGWEGAHDCEIGVFLDAIDQEWTDVGVVASLVFLLLMTRGCPGIRV